LKRKQIGLADARKAKGFTQAGLAGRVGVRSGAVGNWECGLRMPRPDHIRTICRLLGVPFEQLVFPKETGGIVS